MPLQVNLGTGDIYEKDTNSKPGRNRFTRYENRS